MICICNLPKSNVNWNLYPFPGQKQDLRVWLFYLYSPKVPVFFNPHPRICLLILERKRGRERETSMWKRNIDLLLPIHDPTRDWTHNLRMCPDWKWNPQIFGVQDNTLPNWDTQPSNFFIYFNSTLILNPIMQNYHFYTIKTHLHLVIYLPCFFYYSFLLISLFFHLNSFYFHLKNALSFSFSVRLLMTSSLCLPEKVFILPSFLYFTFKHNISENNSLNWQLYSFSTLEILWDCLLAFFLSFSYCCTLKVIYLPSMTAHKSFVFGFLQFLHDELC